MFDKQSLLDDGWRKFNDSSTSATYSFVKFFRVHPACRTNGKLWINLRCWDYRDYVSFEVEIRAQTSHDDWVILNSYGFQEQSLIPEKCDRLLKAWKAIND